MNSQTILADVKLIQKNQVRDGGHRSKERCQSIN